MELPAWPELPECPVCLQYYDGAFTTPRVLSCGHSVCETCLAQLPNPFPQTIRCPACTQLVKFPSPQGILALPKNIDLLRLSSLLQQNPNSTSVISKEPSKPNKSIDSEEQLFIPNLWSQEFYSTWRDCILPEDCVVIDPSGGGSLLYGKMLNFEGLVGLPIRCLWKENQQVVLVKVGFLPNDDNSRIVYSYVAKVMMVLYGMRDGERAELGLILRSSLNSGQICKAYGLWYNKDDHCVYIVCESHSSRLFDKLDDLENGSVAQGNDEKMELNSDANFNFLIRGMEICEAVMSFHSEGLIFGSLGLSCFSFDDFGHACIEIHEVLLTGMSVNKIITKAISSEQKNDCKEPEEILKSYLLENFIFVCPELFIELLQKGGVNSVSGSPRYAIGYGADVWSLACVLMWFLVGKPFMEEMREYIFCLLPLFSDKENLNLEVIYMGWLEKVKSLLHSRMTLECVSLKDLLLRCLDFDPGTRPDVIGIWKCIRGMIINPRFDMVFSLKQTIIQGNKGHCLVQGEICQLLKETKDGSGIQEIGVLQKDNEVVEQVENLRIERDVVDGVSQGHVKCIELKGHFDCVTGLAIGGGFLFSSSFDKTVHLWSLEDFTHVHSFKGHEHKVMAVVFVDEEQPLCISGDNGGGICIWGISIPFGEEPIKKLSEEKDWRYSGIHALAVSGTGYFYTGNGDRSIKAWSMENYTLSCTLTGHKSVVSTLAVCNGVLYSGSWDGTVRLWCLSDHSPLTVLGENIPGNVTSVLCLAADQRFLVVAYESGQIKIWSDNILIKSTASQDGAIFSVSMKAMLIFTGGWSKTVNVQELHVDNTSMDVVPIGSIACDAVVTALSYWHGKLIVGQADRIIKVYHYGV